MIVNLISVVVQEEMFIDLSTFHALYEFYTLVTFIFGKGLRNRPVM